MTPILHDVHQRSEEWAALRRGRLTSSCAADMLARGRGKEESKGKRNLRLRLALERITGKTLERDYVSGPMRDGMAREEDARVAYEVLTGNLLTTVGFFTHPTLMAGASPDAMIGDGEGIAEIKSPIEATHLDYVRTGKVPDDYAKQVIHLLWLTGAKYCDWFSFQPNFPERSQIKLVRIYRNETDIHAYELCARQFLREVEALCAEVEGMVAA